MLRKPLPIRIAGVAALALALPFMPAVAQKGDKNPAGKLGPVEAFEAWRDSMAEGRFGDTFRLLPKRYQKDINRLSATFAEKMDPDLWDGVVGILKTASNILGKKKEIVAGSKFFKGMDDEAQTQLMENWDNAAQMAKAFSESNMLDLEMWKKGDVGTALNGPVSKFIEGLAKMDIPGSPGLNDVMAALKETKAEVVSEDGDSAVLRVTGPDGKVEETEITKVQGRWIPADMAEQWDDGIAQAEDALGQMDFDSEEFQQQKLMVMMGIGMANQMLKQLEEAKSSDEFDRTVESMMKLFGGGGGRAPF